MVPQLDFGDSARTPRPTAAAFGFAAVPLKSGVQSTLQQQPLRVHLGSVPGGIPSVRDLVTPPGHEGRAGAGAGAMGPALDARKTALQLQLQSQPASLQQSRGAQTSARAPYNQPTNLQARAEAQSRARPDVRPPAAAAVPRLDLASEASSTERASVRGPKAPVELYHPAEELRETLQEAAQDELEPDEKALFERHWRILHLCRTQGQPKMRPADEWARLENVEAVLLEQFSSSPFLQYAQQMLTSRSGSTDTARSTPAGGRITAGALRSAPGLNVSRMSSVNKPTTARERAAEEDRVLVDRVRFEARLAVRSQNGRDALREFTGYLLAGDSSLVLYESLHAPVSSSAAVGGRLERDRQLRVAAFLRRTTYTNLQLRKPEPIDLLDLYVGAKWSVLVSESLPSRSTSSPPQDRVVELCVTDIDEPRMHEILLKTYNLWEKSGVEVSLGEKHARLLSLHYYKALARDAAQQFLFEHELHALVDRLLCASSEQRAGPGEDALAPGIGVRLALLARYSHLSKTPPGILARSCSGLVLPPGELTQEEILLSLPDFGIEIPTSDWQKFWDSQTIKRQRILVNVGIENVQDVLTDSIDYYVFLREFFGEMNELRKRLVRKTFQKLDPHRAGRAPLVDVMKFFNAARRAELAEFVAAMEYYRARVVECEGPSLPNTARRAGLGIGGRPMQASVEGVEVDYLAFEQFYEGLSRARFVPTSFDDAALDKADAAFAEFVRVCWGLV